MDNTTLPSFEMGPIRPPSEAYSLLIRPTRNCPWNRCKFCSTYKGCKFELRSLAEIKEDIKNARLIHDTIREASGDSAPDQVRQFARLMAGAPLNHSFHQVGLWIAAGAHSAFLQDANSIIMRTPDLVETLRTLKETFPGLSRITTYGRSHTAARKSLDELKEIKQAGLTRVHIGMESGYDPILEFMDKGVTAADHIAGGRRIVESGLSLSEYVILGLAGRDKWREHALATARVLNEINPAYIRIRTLTVTRRMPLYGEREQGRFTQADDERIIEEERLLIENLECSANYVSDHITNLIQELEGKLPEDKPRMLAIIDKFQSLSPHARVNFRLGRRIGIYSTMKELEIPERYETVEQLIRQLGITDTIDSRVMDELTKEFI